jgi:hypothetical protein
MDNNSGDCGDYFWGGYAALNWGALGRSIREFKDASSDPSSTVSDKDETPAKSKP